jgi:hypothetical protein
MNEPHDLRRTVNGPSARAGSPKEQAPLRAPALGWLRAALDAWHKLLPKAPKQAQAVVRQTLQHWRDDTDLAGVRDKAALAHLPEAEGKEWTRYRGEVASVLASAGPKK